MKTNVSRIPTCVIQMQGVQIVLALTPANVNMDFLVMARLVLKSTNVPMDLTNAELSRFAPITTAGMIAVVQWVMTNTDALVPYKTSVQTIHVQLEASA